MWKLWKWFLINRWNNYGLFCICVEVLKLLFLYWFGCKSSIIEVVY